MNSNDNIATVRDLRKVYDNTLTAVDGISFEIKRGEIFGLLGPNGAGKTTTISMLAGILPPTSGEIVVDVPEEAGHVEILLFRIQPDPDQPVAHRRRKPS